MFVSEVHMSLVCALRLREKQRERERDWCCDDEACSDAGSVRVLCETEYMRLESESCGNENNSSFSFNSLKNKENCEGKGKSILGHS